MNDEEISQRLRALPRPKAPTVWRREILAAAEAASQPRSRAWWAWLPEPRRAAWGSLAAVWLFIFWLGTDRSPAPDRPTHAPDELRALLLSRQHQALDAASLPEPSPAAQPTSAHPVFLSLPAS